MIEQIHWLGGFSFKITGKKLIYINPVSVMTPEPADVILVSHELESACNPDLIEQLATPSTTVIAPNHAADDLAIIVRIAKPGERIEADGFIVDATPAYSTHSTNAEGNPVHPKSAKRCGFVFRVDGTRVYFTGETDFIPEMQSVQCDLAILPVMGVTVMGVSDALQCANACMAKTVVPIGNPLDIQDFAGQYTGSVHQLPQES